MASPLEQFKNLIVRLSNQDIYCTVEPDTRAQGIPIGIRESLKVGVETQLLKGNIVIPLQISETLEYNKDYKCTYKPSFFSSDSTIQYGLARFLFQTQPGFNENAILGDAVTIILKPIYRPVNINEYPSFN